MEMFSLQGVTMPGQFIIPDERDFVRKSFLLNNIASIMLNLRLLPIRK